MMTVKQRLARVLEISRADSLAALARQIGENAVTLRQWGNRDSIPERGASKIARRWRLRYEWVMTGRGPERDTAEPGMVPLRPIRVVGAVEAGVWAEALEWPPDQQYPAPVAAESRYAELPQFGLEVRGPSMNELYPPGSVVICVKLIDLGRDPRPGERVVVQRLSDFGEEATIKEIRRDDEGHYWLWPRSTHPEFQQPWRIPQSMEEYDDTIRIVALVIGSYRPE